MRVIKPPGFWSSIDTTVFLAGSIEMGAAEDWQQHLCDKLADCDRLTILNPRRDDWDSSWEQRITHQKFREQVEWEYDGLFSADFIAFYFDPETKSPITLLELGLRASFPNLVVCCPEGYWRKGNVDIICQIYSIPQVYSLASLEGAIRNAYTRMR